MATPLKDDVNKGVIKDNLYTEGEQDKTPFYGKIRHFTTFTEGVATYTPPVTAQMGFSNPPGGKK